MPRAEWDAIVAVGMPVEIDISATPMSRVAEVSSVVASVAHRYAPPTALLSVFRYDLKDLPTPINQDEYDVWLDLGAHPRLPEMIAAASTSDNPNFRSFCRENVFFSKRQPGPDHWLTAVPSSITAIMKK
jgi:hypothetical protein